MAYATVQQLSDRLGTSIYARLTDRVAGAAANATVAQQILDDSEAEANGFLSRRYRTPIDLAANPELAAVLRTRVLDLAEFQAWKSSPFVGDVPDRVRAVYDEALRWLQSVANGSLPLPAATLPASTPSENDGPRYTATDRAFTHDELDGL
ncbi:MAG: phage protein Gp36 family protein [Phycisphaerae bacterium]